MTEFTILHVFPSFAMGGQQRRLASLMEGLGKTFSHQIVSLDGETGAMDLIASAASVSITSIKLEKSAFVSLNNVRKLNQLIASSGANLLCTYNWGSIEAVMANFSGSSPAHIHFEDGFGSDETIESQKITRIIARRLALWKSDVVVPSTTLATLAATRWRLAPKKIHHIPNGIDLDRFAETQESRQRDDVVVGSIGALRTEKNFARLILACADTLPAISLKIYGNGPEFEALSELSLRSDATLCGETSTPELVYPSFDIFALSSDTEQMPISLIEAMAVGLPVVSTDVGDIASMVCDENRKFITPLGDDQAYAQAITALANDVELRRRLGRENARKARSQFSLAKMATAHRDLYVRVMEKNARISN